MVDCVGLCMLSLGFSEALALMCQCCRFCRRIKGFKKNKQTGFNQKPSKQHSSAVTSSTASVFDSVFFQDDHKGYPLSENSALVCDVTFSKGSMKKLISLTCNSHFSFEVLSMSFGMRSLPVVPRMQSTDQQQAFSLSLSL